MRRKMLFFILTAILYGVDPRTERYPRGVIEFLVRLDDLLFGLGLWASLGAC